MSCPPYLYPRVLVYVLDDAYRVLIERTALTLEHKPAVRCSAARPLKALR